MARPQRFCIFCGASKLTKEHIWADWIKQYLPKNDQSHEQLTATIFNDRSDFKVKKVSGDLRNRRLKIVCGDCNGGWMSRLQSSAKPHLIPLINGEAHTLTHSAQSVLISWITMFVMVAENFDQNKVSTPQFERDFFKATLNAPPAWLIYIGNFQRVNWKGMLAHFACPVSEGEDVFQLNDGEIAAPNTQTMTFVVGKLFVHVRASTTDIFKMWAWDRHDLMLQLAPPLGGSTKVWPPANAIIDRDADLIAADFHIRSNLVSIKDFNSGHT